MGVEGRLHGHFVTGHVDTVAKVTKITKASSWDIILSFKQNDNSGLRWVTDKGSISVNGVSLTVNEKKDNSIRLTLIPHTLEKTNLIGLKTGDTVNIEFDILAKYVEGLITGDKVKESKLYVNSKNNKNNITEQRLRELGYVK